MAYQIKLRNKQKERETMILKATVIKTKLKKINLKHMILCSSPPFEGIQFVKGKDFLNWYQIPDCAAIGWSITFDFILFDVK